MEEKAAKESAQAIRSMVICAQKIIVLKLTLIQIFMIQLIMSNSFFHGEFGTAITFEL